MTALARAAVVRARVQFNVKLNFSKRSIDRVEGILAELHRLFSADGHRGRAKRKKVTAQRAEFSYLFGAYIGEVFRKYWGGRWRMVKSPSSDPQLALEIGGLQIFPASKVYKRLMKGEEDDVEGYFRVVQALLKDNRSEGKHDKRQHFRRPSKTSSRRKKTSPVQ